MRILVGMRKAVRAIVVKDNKLLVMHRNKFGHEYYTLIGGGIDHGETAEQALHREVMEETGVSIANPRLVFVEEAGQPYGTQYVYFCDYVDGEAALTEGSEEALIHALGQNLYTPTWLPLGELADAPFVSEKLKKHMLQAFKHGWRNQPVQF